MQDRTAAALSAAMQALEQQRATLGDVVLELALAPLRAQLAALQRPAGLQRRQVTVLFADVVGSTSMASSLDTEDTLDLLNSALQRMGDLIQQHGGRVLRFTGDGVKAAFGMGETREDDGERAVRAGLAIVQAGREQAAAAQRTHGIGDFAVRVGVHTGDVAMGAGVEADNTAMGAAVNTAARMEQSAPPGTLRISHDTWNQVRGLFDAAPQPPLLVKGIAAPMQTYLVHAALDRSFVGVQRGLQGLTTAMVGRGDELQQLLQAVATAHSSSQLQAVTLLGDAGLGKSRLLRELLAALPAQPACRLLTVRAQPDGQLRPWGLLRSLLAAQCGVADTDSAESARAKVEQGLAPWFIDVGAGDGDAGADGPDIEQNRDRALRQAQLLGQLSGLDFGDSPHVRGLDPRMLRDQAFAALRSGLQGLARRGALPVLLAEDLHWADDGSLDLLQHLHEHAAQLPLVLLMTARPTLLARRPQQSADGTELHRPLQLHLQPLAATDSDALAHALLHRLGDVPSILSGLIAGRAEGNPYYMEELVRRLIDDGVISIENARWTLHEERLQDLRLPGTLVGLLQARLDSLPAAERLAARQASVIGHVFWDDALRAVNPAAPPLLPALQHAAFVKAHDTSDFEHTAQRQFDHHLLHQVTYDTLLKAERRLGHGAVARWLVVRTQDRGAEFLAMTGEHAERAGDVALAITCFEQAGHQAQKRFANAAAESWLRRAVVLLGDSEPARRFDLLCTLQALADTVGDRSAQDAVHAEMATVLELHPDDARQAGLWYSLALLAERRGDKTPSEQLARQACALAERCATAETAALSHALLLWLHVARQDHAAAHMHVAPGLLWAARMDAGSERDAVEARLLTLSGILSFRQSRYDEAEATLLDVLRRGEALGVPRIQLGALDNLAVIHTDRAHWDVLRSRGERMLAVARASGNRPYVVRALWRLTTAASQINDHTEVQRLCQELLPLAREVGDRSHEGYALSALGLVQLTQGDADLGMQLYLQAQAVFRAIDLIVKAHECASRIAQCEMKLGRPEAALLTLHDVLRALEAGDLRTVLPAQTMGLRWVTFSVLDAQGDPRAPALVKGLHADVQADMAALAGPADRERLMRDRPMFGLVVAAFQRLHANAHPGH